MLSDLVKCFTATLSKPEKLHNDLSVITTFLAKLHVWRKPWANKDSFTAMQHRVHYMKTYVRFILAGDISLLCNIQYFCIVDSDM
jgi:hypothetical protein